MDAHLIDNEKKISRIFDIYTSSEGLIRPHFILTGPSGSGKTHIISKLANTYGINFLEINAAQLTKEGTAGNSLSKALTPLLAAAGRLTVCFVDEFDKLFISGNQNSSLAHETTVGVQNEFLKILESDKTSVYGDFGKYVEAPTDKVLFIFAGAFNGEEKVDLDRLREFGIKTEFLGRVGLVYSLEKLSIESLREILEDHPMLSTYLELFPNVPKLEVVRHIMKAVKENYENNTLGTRILTTFLNQYFINGGVLTKKETKSTSFQKTLVLE